MTEIEKAIILARRADVSARKIGAKKILETVVSSSLQIARGKIAGQTGSLQLIRYASC
jgi:hypothetical protein